MKFLKSYMVQLAVIVVLLVLMVLFFNGTEKKSRDSVIKSFNNGWTHAGIEGEVYYDELPKSIDSEGSSKIILKKELPDNIKSEDTISFFTIHQNVHAYIDGKLIYDFSKSPDSNSKTPGNSWNIIDLKEAYSGKILTIEINSIYDSKHIAVPDMSFGSSFVVLKHRMMESVFPLIITGLMLICGIFVIVLGTVTRKNMNLKKEILWLGLFALLLSVWSLLEIQILPVLFGHNLIFSQLSFITLKLAMIPIIRFIVYIYEVDNTKIIDGLCIAAIVDSAGSAILQATGIADFAETLIISHLLYLFIGFCILYLTVKVLRDKSGENTKRRKIIYMNSICISVVGIAAFMDVIRFYFTNSPDSALYSRIGLLAYTVVLIVFVLSDSVELIREGRQAENIKETALVDGLTKVKNRNAYQQEIFKINSARLSHAGIAMFDLNNLKYFNDVYGHSIGDYYIIICSEIIMDTFSKYGEVYRIGGDEFCAVVFDLTNEEFESCQLEMTKRVNGLNVQFIESRMAIASGYALFDPKMDINLNETAQRADHKMYEKKAKMKLNQVAK